MSLDAPSSAILIGFVVLSILLVLHKASRPRFPLDHYVPYVWAFFLVFNVAEFWSFEVAIWVLALLCFVSLKEFFTLVDIRWQDRWAVLGAYAAIPFTIYFIQIDWYGMFIISVPVYAFLVVPFLVALGGRETRGAVLSIGIIDFGLFLFVYCVGHLGYLALYSSWKALVVILGVIVSDLVATLVQSGRRPGLGRTSFRCLISIPLVAGLYWALADWTGIGTLHSVALGALTPILAAIGRYTIAYIESDLGVERESAVPGKGRIVDTLRSFVYVSPVAFHYVRYFEL